jgi:hypothetical protein
MKTSDMKEYHKQWFNNLDEEKKKERNRNRTVRRHINKEKAIEALGGKCLDCGVVYPHYVYDFHHLDQSIKTEGLNKLLNCSLSRVMEEIKNCVLLCANCHRIRHKAEHNRKSRSQDEINNSR